MPQRMVRCARLLFLGLEERPPLELFESLAELLLRVHHDGAVPGNRLLERLTRDQKKSDPLVSCLDSYFITAVEENQGTVICLGGGCRIQPSDPFGGHRERARRIAELSRPCED